MGTRFRKSEGALAWLWLGVVLGAWVGCAWCEEPPPKGGAGGGGSEGGGGGGAAKGTSRTGVADEELPWRDVKQQRCNIGMQSSYRKPLFRTNQASATCGVYNKDLDVDFTGRPCCCSFCGQPDPNDQLCEITKHVCSTVADCIQRKGGECVDDGEATGVVESFHVFWIVVVSAFTAAPFIVPVFALRAAEDIVLGLAG